MMSYIDASVINQHRLPWKYKANPYTAVNLEGEPFQYEGGNIDRETDLLTITINNKWNSDVTLDIVNAGQHDIVLGYPWLEAHNPVIDWKNGQVLEMDSNKSNDDSEESMNIHDDLVNEEKRQDIRATQGTRHAVITKKELQPGIRHKQGKALRNKLRVTIGRIMTYLKSVDEELHKRPKGWGEKPKEEPEKTDEERMANVPKEYHKYTRLFRKEVDAGLPPRRQWDHKIELKDGTHPSFSKIYNLNEKQLNTLRDYVDKHLETGHIRESSSEAGSPVMFVPKKNGKLRLVIDYRQLNDITIKDRTPLPLITELRDRLHGKKWFTAVDLKGAYSLIRMAKGEEWKTAFRTRFGLFEFLIMPQGLTNAPATFQKMITNVLRKYLDISCVVYLDDILIFSDTLEEHKKHVHEVFRALEDASLLVEPEKCSFHTQEVTFLGHLIRPNEIRMEPVKVQAVRDWKEPTNVKETQAFIGFANYYRRFIPKFGGIGGPLTALTRKDVTFEWTPECQVAFDTLKAKITSEPVLYTFDPERQVELETDASDFAIAAQIGQKDDNGKVRPVAYFSRKLTKTEMNYPIYDKEFLAIIAAIKEFRHYMHGSKHVVMVYTDHKNISYFTTTRELVGRQVRYAEYLSEFDIEIHHRKGSENGRADALSRRSDYEEKVPRQKGQILELKDGVMRQLPLRTILLTTEDRSIQMIQEWVRNQRTNKRKIPEVPKECMFGNDLFTLKDDPTRVWVPANLEDLVILNTHESPEGGHHGERRTYERLKKMYTFPGMRQKVQKLVSTCDLCRRTKADRHKPYGELQPVQVPSRPFEAIAMDFITGLPPSIDPTTKNLFDAILVIPDRLTKFAYFIPVTEEGMKDEEFAFTFLRNIAAVHGMPEQIITDRGSLFASRFWKTLAGHLGTKTRYSTAYRPQVDGITERMNQTLEQYLRAYVNYEQNDWVEKLPMAQYSYNTSVHDGTKMEPARALFGFTPSIQPKIEGLPQTEKAMLMSEQLLSLHGYLQVQLEFLQKRMAKYYNQKRLKGPTFSEGDMVYLVRRNIKTDRPSLKLDFKKLGPFAVKKRIKEVTYELTLPETMKIHPVFHVSLLEPAPPGSKPAEHVVAEEHGVYEAERIMDKKVENRQTFYLVKWKNYPESENTWEPVKHLTNCQRLVKQFQKTRPKE
jgi:hypothetical protein